MVVGRLEALLLRFFELVGNEGGEVLASGGGRAVGRAVGVLVTRCDSSSVAKTDSSDPIGCICEGCGSASILRDETATLG